MKELFLAREVDPAKFGMQPDTMVWQSWTDTYSIPWPRVQEIQLEALQTRFGQMTENIPVLATLAEEQGIKKLNSSKTARHCCFRNPSINPMRFHSLKRRATTV